jgi:hypothetical protein
MFNYYLVVRGADTVWVARAVCIVALASHLYETIEFERAFNLYIMKTIIPIEIQRREQKLFVK